jgi:hypothetical protein
VKIEIVVTQRTADYHAALASNPKIWGCGQSEEEAIGDLVRSHPEMFDVTFSVKKS